MNPVSFAGTWIVKHPEKEGLLNPLREAAMRASAQEPGRHHAQAMEAGDYIVLSGSEKLDNEVRPILRDANRLEDWDYVYDVREHTEISREEAEQLFERLRIPVEKRPNLRPLFALA